MTLLLKILNVCHHFLVFLESIENDLKLGYKHLKTYLIFIIVFVKACLTQHKLQFMFIFKPSILKC